MTLNPLTMSIRVCAKTVMDTTDPDITFDEQGVSNWWHDFHEILNRMPSATERMRIFEQTIERIKLEGKNKPYDSILGLSGGVDSSYMAFIAHKYGLRPLVVHFDGGWDSEEAVSNVQTFTKKLGFRLETFVMNWPEMRDLQRAYFKASVIDLDMPQDHMINGALCKVASKHNIKWVLDGNNFATEWLLPRAWYYAKGDFANLKGIHKKFGEAPLKHVPALGAWQDFYYRKIRGIQNFKMLELHPYSKTEAKRFLMKELGWRDYGGKHYESVFTRVYQGYILPLKYGIDKRKAHLSNLILNGEITREQALAELQLPTDDPDRQKMDKIYVAKKLGWSEEEFDALISQAPVPHEAYGTDAAQRRLASLLGSFLHPFAKVARLMGVRK